MKDLIPAEQRSDAFSRILSFLSREDVVLTAEEEKILDRWNYADSLMSQRRYRHAQMVEKIKELYKVSKYTAQHDLAQAQALFAQTRTISKQYVLAQHIEDIQRQIQLASTDKSQAALLPKLYDSLTKALAQLPQDEGKKKAEKPIIFIGTIGAQTKTETTSFSSAVAMLKRRKSEHVEDIDHEDVG